MGVAMGALLGGSLNSLRYERTAKRIRVSLGDRQVADTRDALLVWEPRRVVPTYAVPVSALSALSVSLEPAAVAPVDSGSAILDPRNPFAEHTCAGASFDVVASGRAAGAAFRPVDPDLAGYVVLAFDAFEWLEEDEPIVAHPHDPFHRIDILRSSRDVRVSLDGLVLAHSAAPMLLFETYLPVRFYLPRADVVAELEPSSSVTYCAYKGRASYFSLRGADVAWTYREPLREAEPIRDLVCFFDERVDVIVDGEQRERPVTPFS
ncbi:MAG: DUF427 domain-containing protein [Mycobacteriaceae bacterium]|nr:DUF427 domain-containing protein [Mycobacteriaceae bacterium]